MNLRDAPVNARGVRQLGDRPPAMRGPPAGTRQVVGEAEWKEGRESLSNHGQVDLRHVHPDAGSRSFTATVNGTRYRPALAMAITTAQVGSRLNPIRERIGLAGKLGGSSRTAR